MRPLQPVSFTAVKLEDDFWRERLDVVLTRTIPSQHAALESHGILESLLIPQPAPPLRVPKGVHGMTPQVFWDSDVGKWIEAASYALSFHREHRVEIKIDEIVDRLERAQLPDGYLNCWYIGREIHNRWTNLRDKHELYCAGHLLEGAVAYWQATGKRKLLDIMERYLAHIAGIFGDGEGQKRGYCGHPEIELALVKAYRATGNRAHLDLARYFVDERGRQPHYFDLEARARGDDPAAYYFKSHEYSQSHKPVREQDKVVGHAVRAMYLYAAMADLAAETGDDSLRQACERLWSQVTAKRMYVTAGLGPSATNEGFTADYDLPNDTAYAETCAAVALIFWAQRMLNLDCNGLYGDVMELALFNGALSGLSRDGELYFYQNVLASHGADRRWAWHPCPCCTMNVARLVASVGGYFYATSDDTLAVHLYCASTAEVTVGEIAVRIRQEADYPWSGAVAITLEPAAPAEFTLKLRIPGWSEGAAASVNGEPVDVDAAMEQGYLALRRRWAPGDRVAVDLPMPVTRVYAHPDVRADSGRVALRRGPLVYCVEQADNLDLALPHTTLPRSAPLAARRRPDLLGGTVAIEGEGAVTAVEDWNGQLYRPQPPVSTRAPLTAIPYYLWCNRGPGEMRVWLPEC